SPSPATSLKPPETEERARPDGKSTEQPEPQELPRQNVDVALIAFLPLPHSDDRDDDLSSLDPVDDAVPLTGGANTAEAIQLTDQRLALLLGRFRKLPGAIVNGALGQPREFLGQGQQGPARFGDRQLCHLTLLK